MPEPATATFPARLLEFANATNLGSAIIEDRLVVWRTLESHSGAFASASIPTASINTWQRRAIELGLLYLFLALTFIGLLLLLRRLKLAREQGEYRALMPAEMNHRVKNVIQIIRAMIYSSSREARMPKLKISLVELGGSLTALSHLFETNTR